MPDIPTTKMPDGTQMPVFGLGTWRMGEDRSAFDTEVATLRAGLDQGITLIDTAEMYGSGGAERVVRDAISGRRDEVFIVSKVLPSNASHAGTMEACKRSLDNLGTDRIDLYLLHWPSHHPLAETVRAFKDLEADGRILRWGVSNFDVDEMQELEALSRDCAANQVLYNLTRRGIEHDLIAHCQKRSIPIMAYSPIEQGRLARNPELARIAQAHDATPAQIALAWVLSRPGTVAIPKTSRPERVEENLTALDIELTDQDMATLDQAFPPPGGKKGLEMI